MLESDRAVLARKTVGSRQNAAKSPMQILDCWTRLYCILDTTILDGGRDLKQDAGWWTRPEAGCWMVDAI